MSRPPEGPICQIPENLDDREPVRPLPAGSITEAATLSRDRADAKCDRELVPQSQPKSRTSSIFRAYSDTSAWCFHHFRPIRRLEQRLVRLEEERETLHREIARLRAEREEWMRFYPPGHFHSPIPSAAEVIRAFERARDGPPFLAIDFREQEQYALLQELATHYATMRFPELPSPGFRYHLDNPSYSYFDGIVLHCMLSHLQPRRIVEIGSGFSSAAMLDLSEHVFGGRLRLTCIDPDMTRLRSLLHGRDTTATLIERRVQDIPSDLFRELDDRDVLFIDSSHVSKVGSDVNHLVFDVLPRLRPGVYIHVHDVAADFEYPRDWFAQGRAWNEQYLLRAFLMYNTVFRIVLSTTWVFNIHHDFLREHMPLCAGGGGGQIWLRKDG